MLRNYTALDDIIQVRLERAEKRRFVEIAKERGVTLSDLVRLSLTEATKRVAA
ncbi:hypothetical protein CO731_01511 [Aminobacter sp. MSH1]|uniref:hypothetical protein n=1 Tax=Aminobacter sp. MSH1 TaxID=374606 RepID=UPI000D505642|nr:hypothetical protein [Aminobacter sp. MSH1]AWC22055.1 hypothetical protein CO731_01511 [Aminobacter sp. MSH1]